MIFLKSLLFILYNVAMAFALVYSIKFILFYPKEKKFFLKKKVPLTPGLVPKYRKKLMDKLKITLHDYLNACQNFSENNMVTGWEEELYNKAWERLSFFEESKFIPSFLKNKLRHSVALLVFEITRGFLRSFVPYLIQKFEVKKYIELLDEKISIKILEDYYNKYVYKYMLIIVMAFYFLIGIANMILYLIIPK
ncbi:MAG: hypothetical protein SVM86_06885 [Candidatus Cloacimonadota bacterium]|nr:hypothetical protein [Candidatus Cloacimonadota bacterium]